MKKTAVIYWSGTGNTEAMADLVASAATAAGASVDKFTASEFNTASAGDYTGFALGCPAMGAEQLEEGEFEPMFSALEGTLSGKKIALFGSYGWGDGQWMREWCQRCSAAQLYDEDGLILNESPDADGQETCRELGRGLARW